MLVRLMSNIKADVKILKDVDLVVFDKDGTLIDIHHYWCSMIRFRAEKICMYFEVHQPKESELYVSLLDGMGIDVAESKMKSDGPVGIKPRAFIIKTALDIAQQYRSSISEKDVSDIFLEVDRFSLSNLKDIVVPLPGVISLLNGLKQYGVDIAIATTDLTDRAQFSIDSLSWGGYFSCIAGGDSVSNPKPAGDLVNYIVKNVNVPVSNVVVIGDSIVDLEMAENAGCRFIGVQTGLYTPEFLTRTNYLVENLMHVGVEA